MQRLYLKQYLETTEAITKVRLYGKIVAIASEQPTCITKHMDDNTVIAFFYAKQINLLKNDNFTKKANSNVFELDDIILIYLHKKHIDYSLKSVDCELYLYETETIYGKRKYITNFGFRTNYNLARVVYISNKDKTIQCSIFISLEDIDRQLKRYTNQFSSSFKADTDLAKYMECSNPINENITEKTTKLLDNFKSLKLKPTSIEKSIEKSTKEVPSVYTVNQYGLTDSQKKQVNLINSLVDKSTEKRKETIDKLLDISKSKESTNKYITFLCNAIEKYFYPTSTQGVGICGKELLKKYMQALDISKNHDIMGTPIIEYILQNFYTISEGLCSNKSVASELYFYSDEDLYLYNKLFSNADLFYAGIVGILTGTPIETMRSLYYKCKDYDLSISVILNTNPYIFSFIADDIITAKRIEILAQFFNLEITPVLSESRYLTYLTQSTLLDTPSTMFELADFSHINIGVTFTENQYNRLITTGSVLTTNQLTNATRYLVRNRTSSYDKQFIYKKSNEYIYTPNGYTKEKILVACMESGFLTRLGSTCFSVTTTLKKELYVLNTMLKLSENTYNYDIDDVRDIVNEYENELPFTLEQDQRNAAGLIRFGASIITGVAGSGKTTIIRMFIRLLEKLEPNANIEFVAPTGRAAKRMREVLGVNAKTIHRNFKLNIATANSLSLKDINKAGKQRVLFLFLDEGAMVTLDVFYDMLIKINCNDRNTRIYLFGDINQLPPIGKGTPFRDLLYFLPNVKFLTCKRTAAESNINAMATQFIQDKFTTLKSEKDLFIVDCNKDKIPNVISDLCLYYLNKSTESIQNNLKELLHTDILPNVKTPISDTDISIISPVAKERYNWGSIALNKVLEPIFNNLSTIDNSFICRMNSFSTSYKLSVGDRVMHVKTNDYKKCHYIRTGINKYELIEGEENVGVFNGEIGTIIDIIKSTEISLIIDELKIPENCLNDSSWVDIDNYFIVVQFYDDITNDNYYVLYRAKYFVPEKNEYNLVQGLEGEDLNFIELAYATTVYKYQGSQQKIIILSIAELYTNFENVSTFLCRELLYTAMTRGELLVFIVGPVGGESQTFLKQLHDKVALNHIVTLGTKLVDTERK